MAPGRAAVPIRRSRKAFNTTTAELADMPTADIHGASKPSAAAGIATRLYAVAQARF